MLIQLWWGSLLWKLANAGDRDWDWNWENLSMLSCSKFDQEKISNKLTKTIIINYLQQKKKK